MSIEIMHKGGEAEEVSCIDMDGRDVKDGR